MLFWVIPFGMFLSPDMLTDLALCRFCTDRAPNLRFPKGVVLCGVLELEELLVLDSALLSGVLNLLTVYNFFWTVPWSQTKWATFPF